MKEQFNIRLEKNLIRKIKYLALKEEQNYQDITETLLINGLVLNQILEDGINPISESLYLNYLSHIKNKIKGE